MRLAADESFEGRAQEAALGDIEHQPDRDDQRDDREETEHVATAEQALDRAPRREIALDAGNTWYSIVPIGKVVGY